MVDFFFFFFLLNFRPSIHLSGFKTRNLEIRTGLQDKKLGFISESDMLNYDPGLEPRRLNFIISIQNNYNHFRVNFGRAFTA